MTKIPNKKNNTIKNYKKMLEINKDNINAVLLELKSNKKQLNINIKNIIIFLIKNYETPEEILCKLKILHDGKYLDDNCDKIMRTIIFLTQSSIINEKLLVFEFIMNLDYFSRMVCIWYFNNKELTDDVSILYGEKLVEIMYKLCKIDINEQNLHVDFEENKIENEKIEDNNKNSNFNKCYKGENIEQNNKNILNNILSENDVFQLEELEDSEEIERINTNLGRLFKKPMSKQEKQKVAKICDILEIIVQNTTLNIYESILPLLDVDDILYKKIFGIIKISPDKKIFIECLRDYKNTWRNINFIYDKIGMLDVFECACENEFSTFEFLDRSKISKIEFYDYIFSKNINSIFELLILHFLKTETDKEIIEKIKHIGCSENVVEMCDIKLGKL